MSHRRLMGWTPETFYGRDESGEIVASTTESEWDEEGEQAELLLALDEWRNSRCPHCGGTPAECSRPDGLRDVEVPLPARCNVATALADKQENYDPKNKVKHKHALIWKYILRPGKPRK